MIAELAGSAYAAQRVEPNLNRLSSRKVNVPYPEQVKSYLAANPRLIEITEKVCALAEAEFSGETRLSLELYVDPEVDDQYLTLYVRQPEDDQNTWDKVERIRESYQDDLAVLSGWLHVTVDFRSPKN